MHRRTPWRHGISGGCKTRQSSGQRPAGHGDMVFPVVVKQVELPDLSRCCHGDMVFPVVVKPMLAFALVKSAVLRLLLREKAQNGRLGRGFPAGFFRKAGCRPHRVLLWLRGAAADSRVKVSGGCGRPLSPAHCTKPGAIAPGRREVSAATGRGETRQGEDDGWGRTALWRAAPPSIAGNCGVLAAGCGREGKGDMDAGSCEARRRETGLRGCGCGMMGARQPGLRGDPADAP